MRDKLQSIMKHYLIDKTNQVVGPILRKDLRKSFENLPSPFITKGSSGNGNKAEIPWFAIFNSNITKTATRGYYIVYLFSSDMECFYLSLNQGWTFYESTYGKQIGKEKINVVTTFWKNKLELCGNDITFQNIDLKCKGDLGKGYELGHICGKIYHNHSIPSDSVLRDDVNSLISIYNQLFMFMKGDSFETANKKILLNDDLGLELTTDELVYEKNIIEEIHTYETASSLTLVEEPSFILNENTSEYSFSPKKIDFEKKEKINKKIGFAGELMVLFYEREYLKNANREDLSKQVEHISKTKGDGCGYDILSYDISGNEKYIEVKTTTGSKEKEFFISDVEVSFSQKKNESYHLYRVYDFDEKNKTGKLYIKKGNIRTNFNLKETQFKAFF